MLVPVPIGCWLFSFACDLAFVLGSGASLWFTLGFWTMIGGLIGALGAAVPGVVELACPGKEPGCHRVGVDGGAGAGRVGGTGSPAGAVSAAARSWATTGPRS